MNSGTFNTVANTSAFIAIMNVNFKVSEIKFFSFSNVTGEQTFAAAWSLQATDGWFLGVIGTDNHHMLFYTNPISTFTLDTLYIYPNAITGTTLLTFQTPDDLFDFYAYFIQTSSAGDREILVNWRNAATDNSSTLLLHKTGYDVYHTRRQITYKDTLWSGYVYQNRTDPSMNFSFNFLFI